jgi:hypothetical protein
MRKKITDKKHKKKQHHKTIKHRSKQHTRKYHAKRHNRRTRRQGGMLRRLCSGLSCMTPRQEDVHSPDNQPEISNDITRSIANGYIELLKVTSRNNNRNARINEYINIIYIIYKNGKAEGIDFIERNYIFTGYMNFLREGATTPDEIENYMREIQLFVNIRNLIDRYKLFLRAQQNDSTRGRIMWPPADSNATIVESIETYFNNQLLEEQDLEAEFNQL